MSPHPLVSELLENPRLFNERGRAYQLLEAFFKGLSLESLRPLLGSDDVWVQRTAAFVAAELGRQSRPLIKDVLPLLASSDRHVQNYAMETLSVCCHDEDAEDFGHVTRMLASRDDGVRMQAVDLVASATRDQLEGALRYCGSKPDLGVHERCLREVLRADGRPDAGVAPAMVNDADPLVRTYGTVAFKRSGSGLQHESK